MRPFGQKSMEWDNSIEREGRNGFEMVKKEMRKR